MATTRRRRSTPRRYELDTRVADAIEIALNDIDAKPPMISETEALSALNVAQSALNVARQRFQTAATIASGN